MTLLDRFRAASAAADAAGFHGTAHTLWDLGSQLQPEDTPVEVLDAIGTALLTPPASDAAAAVLRDLVALWDDEDAAFPAVTDDTWQSEGERLGRASRALKDRARAVVAALSPAVPS